MTVWTHHQCVSLAYLAVLLWLQASTLCLWFSFKMWCWTFSFWSFWLNSNCTTWVKTIQLKSFRSHSRPSSQSGSTSPKRGTDASSSEKRNSMTSSKSCQCHWVFLKKPQMTKWRKWCWRWAFVATTVTFTLTSSFTGACVANTETLDWIGRCRSLNSRLSTKSTRSR